MTIFAYGFALVLIAAGIYHFVNPQFYFAFMPSWFPKPLANAVGGVAEVIVGVAMLWPQSRLYGLYGAAGLMLLFLPLHVIDLLRERPVIGSKPIAVFRLALQVFLIGWLIWEARRLAPVVD
ncbi:MauE/DoxX family redox-associated membrane protein [Lewinella sp. JB7]|uniref:DoxX family protein n=1 Tax=Lewinella sp. JB7 TaxID=2962887 RepID=UPI0020C9EC80|nr:MauE/DoxX family redox-associated membrane protein [Lewinella sp. JB7]MCP9235163.1 hypothetical protein [Lewinella sp. JB7]